MSVGMTGVELGEEYREDELDQQAMNPWNAFTQPCVCADLNGAMPGGGLGGARGGGKSTSGAKPSGAVAEPAKPTSSEAVPTIQQPYVRPTGATTAQQRSAVQGKPCVDCGAVSPRQRADHIEPLVTEYYRTGTIDLAKMRSVEAVQPQCATCSARQGGFLSGFSKMMKDAFGFGN